MVRWEGGKKGRKAGRHSDPTKFLVFRRELFSVFPKCPVVNIFF